jgi:hypothetical protein
MYHKGLGIIATIAAGMLLLGCKGEAVGTKTVGRPATVEKLDGGITRIKLTESAAKRLGIRLEELKKGEQRLEASYAVIVYDNHGGEWAYAMRQPNVFERAPVNIERVEGDKVYLVDGPPPGTKLVTAGAAELLGIEFGVGEK